MRTSIDFPDDLFRHIKAQAALQGISLKDMVLDLITKGLQAPPVSSNTPMPKLPTVHLGQPMELERHMLSNAGLSELLEAQE